jgi:hypothetical protein
MCAERLWRVGALGALLLIFWASPKVHADEPAGQSLMQPYIEQLKQETSVEQKSGSESNSYTEEMRKKLDQEMPSESVDAQGYTELLRKENSALQPADPPTEPGSSYLEQEQKKLGSQKEGGAIEAVLTGKSELAFKKEGQIHNSFGFRYGIMTLNQSAQYVGGATAAASQPDFNTLYGQNYAPKISLFYEYQFFHHEAFGSLGLVTLGGASFYSGAGQLSQSILNPLTGQTFRSNSQVTFQYLSLPLAVALSYRMNLFYYLRPYLMLGPSILGNWELRSDPNPNGFAVSYGLYLSGGVAILLDWMSRKSEWNYYVNDGIKHTYFTLDLIQLVPVAGPVSFASSGVFMGLMFEY